MSARLRGVWSTAVTAAVLLSVAWCPAAWASKDQVSVFQDDAALVLDGEASRDATMDELVGLGVDVVHSIVYWNKLAPGATSATPPSGFDATDPADYPARLWDPYDGLVRGAAARGMGVILSPTGPVPRWASGCRGRARARRTCRPSARQFEAFVTALGRRYSGRYADENQGEGLLPRVTQWSVWNEPNQGGWLTPQYVKRGGRTVLASPVIYRSLVRAAIRGLRRAGHGSDDVLLGETAPIGRATGRPTSRPVPPVDFFRALLCIDSRGRALRGEAARRLGCARFGRLAVTGVSHHPYTRGGSQPPTTPAGPGEITLSSVARLERIVDEAARRGRLPRQLPIFYTEFGFQTNPPDRIFGIPLAAQAAYINQSDWIAFRDRRVRAVAQYELRDELKLSSFQSGLRLVDGTAKPAWAAYRLPLWVERAGSAVKVFGQVRPAPDGAAEQVEVQNLPPGSANFVTLKTVTTTNRKGFILVKLPRRSGRWRLSWTPSGGGPTITSRVATVARAQRRNA
ncbi:MAG: hypothetical protein QOI98_1020 [Solirubrobacteraceae bacterium]|nr:hypothetical protein [Solirubrobacteraceae bacterium]